MKSVIKYTIGILLLILLGTACNKYLDETPKGSITTTSFYQTGNDLQMAEAALAIKFNGAFNDISGVYYAADDITTKRNGNKIEMSDFDIFNANSSNSRMTNWWNYFYAAIKSANALIANYNKATLATDAQRNNAGGYAYFMRAVSYFYLTRTWGEVPMPMDVALMENRPNAKVADIYNLIVADLQKAETMLPNQWDGPARHDNVDIFPTKGTAKALLANVYLTMAGWPLKQTDKYALAAAKAKEVIDSKATWGYNLLTKFADIWKIGNRFNSEAVFACYYNNQIPSVPVENGSQLAPNPFSPDYEEGGWDDAFGEIAFYNKFPAGPRKDATYQKDYYVKNDPANVVTWQNTLQKHPYFLKYRDDYSYDWATHKANNWWSSATSFLIRYAEVLLTYAEAQAMSSGPDASAYAAINQVRQRAGLNPLTPGLSVANFRDSVVAERGWEFAAECGIRWFDLVRTETVQKVNSYRDATEPPLANQPSDANHTYYRAPVPIVK
ncbi:RagB/SusD family nutrient uptake outer membrane protein [Chitinophaga sp. 22321]|uniref:RagB/SusD family nutrient uptake outer membrane protein n=1 Tax=Chitinophaga hostae TaxID=2831022 RepID=A0ABS5IZ42_9BACT|nr:RagB/SusD family nutrient uptake outer membrane protein [Chitinophaga hostae]MBS0028229.1 RagB/SusD family nutrient uptake outer membrane protein [Chitinophaga hostae]